MAEVRGELVGDQRKAANRITRNVDQRSGNCLVVVVDAFNLKVVVAGGLAANRRTDTDAQTAGGGDAGAQERHVENAALVGSALGRGGNVGKLGVREGGGEVGAGGVKHRACLRGRRNGVGAAA